jgi:predicted HTH transcriptional regulator
MTEEYPQIDDYILNESGVNVDDYDNYIDFLNDISDLFDNQFNDEVSQTTLNIWEENQIEEESKQQKIMNKIKNVVKKLTERGKVNQMTKTEEILDIYKKPISAKELAEITGKPEPSVRRDLAKGVKDGLWTRIGKKGSKGVKYQKL